MKIVSFEDVRSLNISPVLCYNWVSEMIKNKDKTNLPPKTHMNMPGNVFCNVMPCIINSAGTNYGGVKVVTRYPERKPSLDSKILLFNADFGEFLALFDGNWITAMRTGAVATHSILHLAKTDWKNVGLIGLGNVARTTILILASLVQDKHIHVKLFRYKDQAELFCERFKDYSNLEFSIVDSMEECIRDSDVIVSCATYFQEDIALDEWFDSGVLVVPVHTRGFTNCDLFFDKVYADDTGHVQDFKNFRKFKYYSEICDVVNGINKGRENDGERIIAYNIGVSVHDMNYAAHIYEMLLSNHDLFQKLKDADLQDPTEKFWV